jgi:hypothetical protein
MFFIEGYPIQIAPKCNIKKARFILGGMPIFKRMKLLRFLTLMLLLIPVFSVPAFANVGLIAQGAAKTLHAVFQLPANMVTGGVQSFPLGIVTGTVAGSVKMVAGTVSGAFDMARGAAPYAKYLIFL